MRIHLVLSNLSLQPFESFASLPLLLLNLLLVLAISSLLTVLERKGLAASQRRLGPSQHGWFGFLQIVADGIKLIYKDPSILGLFRSSTSVSDSTFVDYLFPPIWSFLWSYFLFIFWWADFSLHFPLPIIFFAFFLFQGLAHFGLLLCGFLTLSKWTLLGSLRSLIIFLIYDLVLLLSWYILLPHAHSGLFSWETCGLLQSFFYPQSFLPNIFLFPILFLIYFLSALVESGRIPADLSEAESELVSGYNLEFAGFLYALFASAEYSNMLWNSFIIAFLFLNANSFFSLLFLFTLVFLSFLIIRATLPRFRYSDLFSLSWFYLIPFQFLFLALVLL
mmetsp:Transcript_8961/g.17061  ORF Transcript_8961/g.17061 Transcript_8961/m.17061 type:complete len:335 (+) Transcript_8961:1-1005(+)